MAACYLAACETVSNSLWLFPAQEHFWLTASILKCTDFCLAFSQCMCNVDNSSGTWRCCIENSGPHGQQQAQNSLQPSGTQHQCITIP